MRSSQMLNQVVLSSKAPTIPPTRGYGANKTGCAMHFSLVPSEIPCIGKVFGGAGWGETFIGPEMFVFVLSVSGR